MLLVGAKYYRIESMLEGNNMRVIYVCLLLVVVCSPPIAAQETVSAQQDEISYDLWRIRSQTITGDLIKDAPDLTSSGRAQLWAKLAERWWREDPEKAHSWMLKSIEMVETVPNKETPAETNQRLATTRMLLKIVAPLNQKLGARLVAILSDAAEHIEKTQRGPTAEGLTEAGAYIVDKDPQRAAELGALALRIGQPSQIGWLISRLRSKDARLADALFVQALAAGRQSLDLELLNSLAIAAFPESMRESVNVPAPPDNLRTELLRLDIALLQANPISPANRNSICISVRSFIAPVLPQFDRLLPQQAPIARQSVTRCQDPIEGQRVESARRNQLLNTVDDLLKAADETQDSKARTIYQYRAAALAKEQNDLDRALKILDSISIEARELMGGSWETYRWEWAADAALRHLKSGDVYGMRLIINAVPTDLQLYAKIAFVRQLPDNRNKDTDPTLEFLNDVRSGLHRSSISDAEKSAAYFALLPLSIKFQPNDATTVLREGVVALNRAEQARVKNAGGSEESSLSGSEFFKNLPASLLEMDEYAVKDAVASIVSTDIRVQVRLELLSVCLARLRNAKQANPKQRPSASKGE